MWCALTISMYWFALGPAGLTPAGEQIEARDCTECHVQAAGAADGTTYAVLVEGSAHAGFSCDDCHVEPDEDSDIPMPEQVGKEHGYALACGGCHEILDGEGVVHGESTSGDSRDRPHCWDCHGTHGILPSSDPRSPVHRRSIATTCESCHFDMDLVKQHDLLRDEPIRLYESSVHAEAVQGREAKGATCVDCHATRDPGGSRTAHRIYSVTHPNSPIHPLRTPETCEQCHREATEEYRIGVHGQLVERGDTHAPTCTHCHGEHGILRVSELRSPVSASRLADATCNPCHESIVLSERFGLPAGRTVSHIDSYHGLKRKNGDVHVANCASCHEPHRILSPSDPRSSVHKDNLTGTCGACHPGITTAQATRPIHGPDPSDVGWPHFFKVLYLYLICGTIGLMLLHNGAHFLKHLRLQSREPSVQRLARTEVWQHWLMMVAFVALVISGFSLRYSEAFWVDLFFGWGGGTGFVYRGLVHRVAGVALMVWIVYHAFYLCGRRGRRWLRDMCPTIHDIGDVKTQVLFLAGRLEREPRFRRFTYMEKIEYWALIWGVILMTLTGVLLWFDAYFLSSWKLPPVVLDVVLVIHFYEAWLATLAIIVWHLYWVLASPTVYPMNPAWWRGRMPKHMFEHEHPAAEHQPE